ncbi:MAG: AMP-binding protein [Actinobacteria bacterium]|nr:AMP-binding protein [Actinomycetota bacterium]
MTLTDKFENIVDLFETNVSRHPDNQLFGTLGADGQYHWVTYKEVAERVDNFRGGLARLGISRGDKVGIISNNRTEWAVGAFAAFGLGAAYVPMYEAELESVWEYIIKDSGLKVLIVSKQDIYDRIKDLPHQVSSLEHIVVADGKVGDTLEDLEKAGESNPVSSLKPDPDEIAVLIYTSGTTADPKGVLLSHGNLSSNARAGYHRYFFLNENDRSLSILPWAHSYGLCAELLNYLQFGGAIAFTESTDTIPRDMLLARPTYLIAVPRIFNKVYDMAWTMMREEGGIKLKLFSAAVETARKHRGLVDEGKKSMWVNLKLKLLDLLVFSQVRAKFGGQLNGAITGSATMNTEIANFFWDIGIPVFDCYGLTETSPAVTMNAPDIDTLKRVPRLAKIVKQRNMMSEVPEDMHRLGSVGKPLEEIKVVIDGSVVEEGAADGEIIVYGPNVMKGYYNKGEQTAEVMTSDGGFRTGDRGLLDENGFLHITGRIKEQYKLENGKYVFPSSIEEDIKLVHCVENAFLYGDGKNYNVCLIYPEFEALEKYADENGLSTEHEDIVVNRKILDYITDQVTSALKNRYGKYEIPKSYHLLTEDFTVENGLLTQTLKLKRNKVYEKYREEIETLYEKSEPSNRVK